MNYQILLIVIIFNCLTGMSQTSLKGELLTLSNNVYLESHDVDSVVIIGSALFNVKTNKVIGFTFSNNNGYGGLEEELMGRWLSPDVYESRLAYSSPYSFAVNKPIIATDPNGKFVRFLNESGKESFTENLKNLTSSDIKLQQELLGALETTKAKMTIEKRDPDTDTWHAEPTIEGIEVTFIGENVHALTKKVANSNLSDEAKTKLLIQLSYLTSSDALVEIEGVDPQTQVNYSTNKTDGKENTPSTLSSSRYSITSKSRANGKPLNDAEVNELTNNGAGAGHPNGDAHREQNIRTTF